METVLEYIISTYMIVGLVFSTIIAANIKALETKFFKRKHVIVYIIFPFSAILVCMIYVALEALIKTLDWIAD